MRECVAALIVQGQTILLGQRSAGRAFYPGVWDVFGGHMEPDETHEQTLERELSEELGITPTGWEYLTTLPEPDPAQHGPGNYHFYRVTAWRGTPTNLQPNEHERIGWFTPDEARHLELAHPAYAWLFARFVSASESGEGDDADRRG